MGDQITTFCLFKVNNPFAKFWAFQQVPLALWKLRNVPGITFVKSMGSGGGKGFDFMPSFSVYSWLIVWENQQMADNFFESNRYFNQYQKRCQRVDVFYLKNIMSHGKWSKVNPFDKSVDIDETSKIVVLTRARIKTLRLWQFWRKVGRTANQLYKFPELEFAIGVGELPFIQQATISIWKNQDAMKHYAYSDETHKNVIKLTRQYQWYSEELFARFKLISQKSY